MKLSYLARLVGLSRSATEQQITDALEHMATRANIAGEGTPYRGGATIYGTQQIAASRPTDQIKETEPYVVRATRSGHWCIFEKQADGSYKKYGVESIALDVLQAQANKLNDRARGKANKANEETITALVNEEMQRTSGDYVRAFCNVKTRKPELFWTMRESAAERERAARR
jgi:hypothetical protein